MEENQKKNGQFEQNELPQKITKEILYAENATTKGKILYFIRTIVMIVLSSLLIAFAAHCLISPNRFTIGGATGIAVLVYHISQETIPQSVVVLAINLPLVVWAFFYVKKKFAVLTALSIATQSLWLLFFETFLPTLQIQFTSNGEQIFATIATGLCIGSALALALKAGGSTGGCDIIALIVQRKIKASSISWALFMTNCIIIGTSFFVFYNPEQTLAVNLLPIMLSAFACYVASKTVDSINNGLQSAIEFRIITDKPEEMAHALMHELSRGVTSLPATGMYTKESHTMLLCVVSHRQVVTLKRIMKSVDPDSFAVMANVSQVLGLGFYREDT